MFIIENDSCAAAPLQHARIKLLLTIAMKRIWDEDRRTPCQRHLRHRHRARACDYEVGSNQCARHIIDERYDLGWPPELAVPVRHHPHISLTGLMNQNQIYNTFC